MVMVPAVALGALVIFGIAYLLTSTVMTRFAKKTRSVTTLYRGVWKEEKRPDKATELYIDLVSKVGGGIAVVVMVLLLLVSPKERALSIWIALTGMGIIFGLFTFLLREPKSSAEIRTKYRPTMSSGASPHGRNELYQNLLVRCRGDKNLADRLIEFERKHAPSASEEELIRSAIQRLERDKRG
ncbi:MAG TPA: hypothetical protein VLZ89_00275 [Anaerolineales bacterium]|nr:hypothetical protein [Anaerolineales bacterium]